MSAALAIQDLTVAYGSGPAVIEGVSISLGSGDRLGLAGESGSGKTTLLRAVAGLLPSSAHVTGSIRAEDRVGYIPQEGLVSLSPFLPAAEQVTEFTRSKEETARLFERVGLGGKRFLDAYPHQLSGGERQRVLTIQALAIRPSVILADEPTANLDPQSEAAVLSLLDEYARETGAAILIASHRERVFEKLKVNSVWGRLSACARLPTAPWPAYENSGGPIRNRPQASSLPPAGSLPHTDMFRDNDGDAGICSYLRPRYRDRGANG